MEHVSVVLVFTNVGLSVVCMFREDVFWQTCKEKLCIIFGLKKNLMAFFISVVVVYTTTLSPSSSLPFLMCLRTVVMKKMKMMIFLVSSLGPGIGERERNLHVWLPRH